MLPASPWISTTRFISGPYGPGAPASLKEVPEAMPAMPPRLLYDCQRMAVS
ncbi:hypothetical protein GCM10027168_44910 [Streptomyces capparidis]